MIRTIGLLFIAGSVLSGVSAEAQVLKNGDFSNGRSHWSGPGKIVTINDAGQPTPAAEGGVTALEISLSKQQIIEVSQRIVPTGDLTSFRASAQVMTSADFQLNDKAHKYTKDINWRSSGWYSWSALVYPRVDFCLRVQAANRYFYLPRALKPGAGWQVIKGDFNDMPPRGTKTFTLVFPAGEGTIWVRSVDTH